MKRHLLPLVLLLGVAYLPAHKAQAQDKPVLNSAPPGPPPAPPRPVEPTPAPAPVPATQPVPEPATTAPMPQPSADSPSGLELPDREKERKAAQEKAEMNTRLFVYSGFGLGYSSYGGQSQFDFSISPALGYRLNDRIAVGPGLSYAYSNYGFSNSAGQNVANISTKSIGVKVFGQIKVINQFLVHAEFENTRAQLLEVDQQGYVTGRVVTRTVQTPLAGLGYRQQFSTRAAADILLLYNFQDDYNRIYSNPVIRFNFLFNIGR
ncbi:hypothetical protein ACFST9_15795 [Hymenobacter monticola]|uniref:Outer membrane protein beta-barrel domain-containing protein n=1 Tax=Hymenobacter monticola TaxID=1705399 RepID=A0ABY4B2N9_9BACT|nr:hypothetical protein [Hymenobacter monticola]UOE32627.1 hypothetical protein MTP16_15995 [Hymenobacter monticola]